MCRWLVAAAVLVMFIARPARADWQPPADNRFSEMQLRLYLETAADLTEQDSKLIAEASKSQSYDQKVNLASRLSKLNDQTLARHHISRAEYDWLAKRVSTAWGVATYLDGTYSKIKSDFQATDTDNDAKLAEATRRLATYKAALDAGTRVLDADERDVVIKSYQRQQQAALDEARQHGDDVDAAERDARDHDVSAKAADELAANPPSDVPDVDHDDYITTKRNEAQVEREAAKDARNREAECKQAQAQSLAAADLAAQRGQHPEIPVTDEQKAAAKVDDQAGIARAQHDIDGCNAAKTALTAALAEVEKSATETTREAPTQNLVLIRKYADQYKQIFEKAYGGVATTAPSS
jgi:hypothetical protein